MNLQPVLQDDLIRLRPLVITDFDELFTVASDPLIWEQHPNPNRYQRRDFETYFRGAFESGGALLVKDHKSGKVLGCSRFYDFDASKKTVLIGYTFLARVAWGTTHNRSLKTLMLNHAFKSVETVYFHVGSGNIRSLKAMAKLGAIKIGEEEVQYYGEKVTRNAVFEMKRDQWLIDTAKSPAT